MQIDKSVTWCNLLSRKKILDDNNLGNMFAEDLHRFANFSIYHADFCLDFSKQKLDQATIDLLIQLAEVVDLRQQQQDLFNGKHINNTENRPALHTELRSPAARREIKQQIEKMQQKNISIRQQFTDVISLGIGGSYLGSKLVTDALLPYKDSNLNLHFISNIDSDSLDDLLTKLNPQNTICIINSKSFTTIETLTNAKVVIDWLAEKIDRQGIFKKHLLAVTANAAKAQQFGIAEDNILEFWDFVGGRYSVWSTVGFPIMLCIGEDNFKQFLSGAYNIDQHFLDAPFGNNIPVMLALIGIWNINFLGTKSLAILPYTNGLAYLPNYLQQLEMESNGKRVDKDGADIDYVTCPVIWGGVGCDIQHAFMQLIHQSNEVIPCDFILPINSHTRKYQEQQDLLAASCLAQSRSLMLGTKSIEANQATEDLLSKAKYCPGDKPSSTILFSTLTPYNLGSLLAIYEHKTFVQGAIWGIQSFDQWGVELGKKIGNEILPSLDCSNQSVKYSATLDSSTLGLISLVNKRKNLA